MPGYNHYPDCPCGWCVKIGRSRRAFHFDSREANANALLRSYGVTASFYSCFLRPNATCPVCSARVWFYCNSYGSRVYFDEPGWPWPKHGCTNTRRPGADAQALKRRPSGEIDHIADLLTDACRDPREDFRDKYQEYPWETCRVLGVRSSGFERNVEAEAITGDGGIGYFRFTSANSRIHVGDLVSFNGSEVSFPDQQLAEPRRFKAKLITKTDYQSAGAGAGSDAGPEGATEG